MTDDSDITGYFNLLVHKLSQNDSYWSSLLSNYLRRHQLAQEDLIDLLKCDNHNLQRLALCRLPRSSPNSELLADLEKTSSFTGIHFDSILRFYRECIAIEAFGEVDGGQSSQGYLNAARKRSPGDEEDDSDKDKSK
jgi:hypothetical protein